MKIGDLVVTPRYGHLYIILGERKDLSSSYCGRVFDIIRTDGSYRQVLNERLLELVSESR